MFENGGRLDEFCQASKGKNLLKVEPLAGIGNVNDPISLELIDTVAQGGQVGGGIKETAIGLANNERLR